MELRDWLILGALGAGAWWLFTRRGAAPTPVPAGSAAPASWAPGASADVGTPLVRSIGYVPTFTGLLGSGLPGAGPMSGDAFVRSAAILAHRDDNPVPVPPAPPSADTRTTVDGPFVRGVGAGSMGPNPMPGFAINPTGTTGFGFPSR